VNASRLPLRHHDVESGACSLGLIRKGEVVGWSESLISFSVHEEGNLAGPVLLIACQNVKGATPEELLKVEIREACFIMAGLRRPMTIRGIYPPRLD
jgi:hypothetical protein